MIKYLVIGVVFFLQFGCKTTPTSAVKINNGSFSVQHDYVIPLFDRWNKFCSAVLVKPDVAISAAHCFERFRTSKTEIQADLETFVNGKLVPLESVTMSRNWYTYPYVTESKTRATKFSYDFAVLKFKEPVSKKVVPIANSPLPIGTTEVNIVGFGCNTYLKNSHLIDSYSHFRRAYNSKLFRWQSPVSLKVTRYEFERNSIANTYILEGQIERDNTQAKISACPGDSGGAMVYDGKLYGVASRTNYRESLYVSLQHRYARDFISKAMNNTKHHHNSKWTIDHSGDDKNRLGRLRKLQEDENFLKTHQKEIISELADIYNSVSRIKIEREKKYEVIRGLRKKSEEISLKMFEQLLIYQKNGFKIFPAVFRSQVEKELLKTVTDFGYTYTRCADLKGLVLPVAAPNRVAHSKAVYGPECDDWPKWDFVFYPEYVFDREGPQLREMQSYAQDQNLPQPFTAPVPTSAVDYMSPIVVDDQVLWKNIKDFLAKKRITESKFVLPIMTIKQTKDKVMFNDKVELFEFNNGRISKKSEFEVAVDQ